MSTLNHGHAMKSKRTPTYFSWCSMMARCFNKNSRNFRFYGRRGITVCIRWRSFAHFLADMGCRPQGKTLDRFPNKNGNYKPGNCRWATVREQNRNRRDLKMVTFGGVTMCLKDWSLKAGIDYRLLKKRVQAGWPFRIALYKPKRYQAKYDWKKAHA